MKKNPPTIGQMVLVVLLLIGTVYTQDFNNDGTIDKADCQAFLHALSSGSGAENLDVNNDGTTNLKDALLFGQWVNGLWSSPSGTYATLYSNSPQDTLAYTAYQKNVAERKSVWTAENLKSSYPDATLKGALKYDSTVVEFIPEVSKLLTDTAYMEQVLETGVAVYTKKEYPNFYSAFDIIHTLDLPVIFTTDAMLQTVYRSYDNILMQLELKSFIPMLDRILVSSLRYLNSAYGDADYVRDARLYFETALKLLKGSGTEVCGTDECRAIIAAITSEQMSAVPLFGRSKVVDFSPFKPRGHYIQQAALSSYFRAMMWLGRADLAFEIGGASDAASGGSTIFDPSRMKKGALVVWDCVVNSGTLPEWLEFNRVIEYMVGTSDGLTIKGMGNLVHDLGTPDIAEYTAAFNEKSFDSVVTAGAYGLQTILSEYKQYPGVTDSLGLTRIFNFMPQRFIIDSYTMSQLVYPLTERRMPSSLDIAFVLGDNTALDDHSELSAPYVPGILGSLRQLYDEITPAGWQSNMYTSWINFLRQLNGVEKNTLVSPVFRTLAWAKKMRNTQLTSWAHLRHNTILYAKQSMTGSITCSHPKAYVEPYPAFFTAVTAYAKKGEELFGDKDKQISGFFRGVADISTRLAAVAALTAQGREPTEEQVVWLRSIVSSYTVGSNGYNPAYKVYDGWYFDLVYDNDPENRKDGWVSFTTIADVHTKPADEAGPARVLHAATGYIRLMTVVVKLDTCTSLFVGPVGSYYDVTTISADSPKRMNDDEWADELTNKSSAIVNEPSWTDMYSY